MMAAWACNCLRSKKVAANRVFKNALREIKKPVTNRALKNVSSKIKEVVTNKALKNVFSEIKEVATKGASLATARALLAWGALSEPLWQLLL